MSKSFIYSRQKELIEIEDFQAALQNARQMVKLHYLAKNSKSHNIMYFEDAHKDWEHILKELEKLNHENTIC